MKYQEMYNERLRQFADHLQEINNHPEFGLYTTFSFWEMDEGVWLQYNVKCHDWVFEELLIFEEWGYNDYGDPVLKDSDPNESTAANVIDYFNLSPDEFCHCFDVEGFQMDGIGQKLNEMSDGQAIAENIRSLIDFRESSN